MGEEGRVRYNTCKGCIFIQSAARAVGVPAKGIVVGNDEAVLFSFSLLGFFLWFRPFGVEIILG